MTQAGSVAAASPAIAIAWQRQPPQSISRRSQLRQGSCIQSVPRNALKAGESRQISARLRSPKRSKVSERMVCAAWQGSTVPSGATMKASRAQPPMQGLG